MNVAIVIALIALARVSLIESTIVTVFGTPALQARSNVRKILDSYREPLIAAASVASKDIQHSATQIYGGVSSTMRRRASKALRLRARCTSLHSSLGLGGHFGGRRFRSCASQGIGRLVKSANFSRTSVRLSSLIKYGSQFMIWRTERPGTGERMIESANGRIMCQGYCSFIEHRSMMDEWLVPIQHDLEHLHDEGRKRLSGSANMVDSVDLVRHLDDTDPNAIASLRRKA